MKYKAFKAIVASLLIVGSIAATAQENNFGLWQRAYDDSDWYNIAMPDFVGNGSTTPALIGSKGDGYTAAYYFLGPTLRTDPATCRRTARW